MGKPLVELENLTKYFDVSKKDKLHAVDGITLTINEGETLGVVGESGCGKSTLGRTVLKLHEPTSGKIIFDGKDITNYKKNQIHEIRQDMQMIFQDPYSSLNPRMTVQSLIAEPMLVNKTYQNKNEVFDMVAELMETVGLAERLSGAYPHELDGGRRQRIGVARALALNPKFIVCDEPVSALDVSIQSQIINLLGDLQERNNFSYIFISHDLSVVEYISNRVAVMYLGNIVEMADKNEIFDNPLHPYTKALMSAIPVPDPTRKRDRIILSGDLPSPSNPPSGCKFRTRCPYATEKCAQEAPEYRDVGNEHFVACHYV